VVSRIRHEKCDLIHELSLDIRGGNHTSTTDGELGEAAWRSPARSESCLFVRGGNKKPL
jgi:hypothetical protein